MSDVNQNQIMRTMMRLAAAGAAAAVLAGCSSDASRLAEGPFSQSDRTPTASIGGSYGGNTLMPPDSVSGGGMAAAQPAPSNNWSSAAVQSQPLAAPGAVSSSPLPAPSNMASNTSSGLPTRPTYGSSPIRSAAPAAVSASAAPAAGGASFGPWSTSGGTSVTVAQGDSASVLAARYGVPQEALLKVNGLSSAAQVTPGARLTIPVYNANAPRTATASAPTPAKAASPATRPMASAAPTSRDDRAPRSLNAQAAAVRPGAKPAATTQAAAKPKPEPVKKAEVAKPAEKKVAEKAAPEKVAKVDERKPAAEERRQVASAPAAAAEPAPAAEKAAADKPEFRWPARGRIIQGFKSGANEGINIAVPEGTQVKAAESGVVAYAGNELKGYGNLVLIRHPNGYVSAYAHNGEVAVKRGENVKRGQTIAKSGQTGNVASPQLHFELRKGSTPVDPTSYLAGL